jgi:hypothetical protein
VARGQDVSGAVELQILVNKAGAEA